MDDQGQLYARFLGRTPTSKHLASWQREYTASRGKAPVHIYQMQNSLQFVVQSKNNFKSMKHGKNKQRTSRRENQIIGCADRGGRVPKPAGQKLSGRGFSMIRGEISQYKYEPNCPWMDPLLVAWRARFCERCSACATFLRRAAARPHQEAARSLP